MADPDASYAAGTPPEWDAGTEAFSVDLGSGSERVYSLTGPCPRCGHELHKDITEYLAPALTSGVADITVNVRCNCTAHHDGQPNDVTGCGAEGGVRLEF
jgi:hypothetical protein